MISFIDNTAVHNLLSIIESDSWQKPINSIDIVALLHFAEHIMFSDAIEVSSFELPFIKDKTKETISLLESYECIDTTKEKRILDTQDFTDGDYTDACQKAAMFIQQDLALLSKENIDDWHRSADYRTRPLGIRGGQITKWIKREWPKEERQDLINRSLENKASGSFDYVLAYDESVYNQLKQLTSHLKDSKKAEQVSIFLDVIFRVNINKELAKKRNAIYSPAPRRALAIEKSDSLFRFRVEQLIKEQIKEHTENFPSALLEEIQKNEVVPLPLFAIHFLRGERISTPLELLQAALKLRHCNTELEDIRCWIKKWEKLYSSEKTEEKEKARLELDKISKQLNLDRKKLNIFSILRAGFEITPNGIKISPDLALLAEEIYGLIGKYKRHRIFLTLLRREYEFDESIGAEICKMLGRPIVI